MSPGDLSLVVCNPLPVSGKAATCKLNASSLSLIQRGAVPSIEDADSEAASKEKNDGDTMLINKQQHVGEAKLKAPCQLSTFGGTLAFVIQLNV